MDNQVKIKNLRKLVWTGSIISLVAIIIAITASWLLYQQTVNLLTENLRERLLTISVTQAANIDADDLAALNKEEDWQTPSWSRVVSKLHRAKYDNDDVVFMYIFRKTKDDPNQMEFIGDADSIDPYANTSGDPDRYVDVNRDGKIEPDGPDKLQWPGQPYPEAVDIPETFEAYEGPLTGDLYTDAYGTVLSGYAPIKDEQGNTVAVLATDIKADDFFTVTRQTLYPFLLFIISLIVIIMGLSGILIYMWDKQAIALADLDRMKTEFVSIASHQLRTPITAIKGYASMLLEGSFGHVDNKVKDAIAVVFDSSQKLVSVVEDFLNITRIELGKMKYDMALFNFKELTERVIGELKPTIERKGIKLNFSADAGPHQISGDTGKISQVISNLIDNSLKYTPKGEVDINVRRYDNKIELSVKDSGVGIAPEVLPKLFEKFIRADDAGQTNISGTGLGLYVAKQIVEAHNGRIWAESEGPGKGSTFYVDFPAK
jgi:signal transduction histidine kinase